MKADNDQHTEEQTALEQEYLDELPRICTAADDDLPGALAAIDRYLAQAPLRPLKKRLLTWKGLFYLEHEMHVDAIRELRAADAIDSAEELSTFNTKSELAKALELGGAAQEAYAVLEAALEGIDGPSLLPNLLSAVARVASSAGLPLPVRAEAALDKVRQHYGIDDPALEDLPSEMTRVASLIEDASARFSLLHETLRHAEGEDQRAALINEYLDEVTVPYYRQLAGELLDRIRREEEPAT